MDHFEISEARGLMDGIVEVNEQGIVVLSPGEKRPCRRVLFVNSYGGTAVWEKIKKGLVPPHHLWGCLELVRRGYEVALAEPLPHFYFHRRPLPHDIRLLGFARTWLGAEDIIYCGHTLLYWLPLLKAIGGLKCRIVSLTYAREHLDLARAHSGIIAMTTAAAEHARNLAPKVKVAHLGWGCDLSAFPKLPYLPSYFFSCGITHRDHRTLCAAAKLCPQSIRLICPGIPDGLKWPSNVEITDGGPGWSIDNKIVSHRELLLDYYSGNAASLIIIKNDLLQRTAVGFTNLLEAMAMARPVIVTRTGALPTEVDVEANGCGLFVPPRDSVALANAIKTLAEDPARAKAMGQAGRRLCDTHYNIARFAADLHRFFESL